MKLAVKVIPNAKKTEVVSYENETLKIRLNAPPVDGKANDALIKFLAKLWDVKKSEIKILRGETGRNKVLEVPDNIPVIS